MNVDATAEVIELSDEAPNGLGLVAVVEVKGTEVAVWGAVPKHVVAGGEHGGRDGQDGLLGAATGLDAQELGPEIGVLGAGSGPGGGNEGGLEPVAALADLRGATLASALVVSWAEASPR